MSNKISLWCLAAAVFGGLGGCQPQRPRYAAPAVLTPPLFAVRTLGRSVENRPIELYSAGYGPDAVFIFAGIHGDEQAGITLVNSLMERLRDRRDLLEGRKILILPNANPDGVVRNTRTNANYIDLNRNFPADNRENTERFGYFALSEPESRILYDLINTCRPIRIVSVHQPLKCIDYDGPADSLADRMAAFCPLPVKKLGARPGSFGSFAGESLGIPVITLELEREDDLLSPEMLWMRYGMSLMAAISYPLPPY